MSCVIARAISLNQSLYSLYSFIMQKETLSDIQLHLAALRGDEMLLRKVLDSGKVHVDCKDEVIGGSLIRASSVNKSARRFTVCWPTIR